MELDVVPALSKLLLSRNDTIVNLYEPLFTIITTKPTPA